MSEPTTNPAVPVTLLPGFVGTTLPTWVTTRLRNGLGGVCVFGSNIESSAQLRALTDEIYTANPRAIIAIDEEGGDVTRLHYATGSPLPGNALLGRIDDLDYTARTASRIGWDLRRVGVNLDFAPDVDVNSNPDNPVIGTRSFGATPSLVAAQTIGWTRGLQSAGVAACAKHFPGHGDTAQDSHLALPIIDRSLAELEERELVPFVAAIDAGTKTIMSSHIMLPQLDPERPATLSRRILQGLLRDQLGFTGVIVSDALDMAGASATIGIPEAAVRALDAGCDLLCIGSQTTDAEVEEIERAVLAAIDAGRLDAARVRGAADRVLGLADELAEDRAALPVPGAGARDDELLDDDVARTTAAFDIRPGVADRIARGGPVGLVRVETGTNVAIGTAPWGPSDEESRSTPWLQTVTISPDHSAIPAVADGELVVVIGRDIHRHAFARQVVDEIRARATRVVVVDMGWPSDDREYADIATFGASRLVGRALSAYFAGRSA